MGKWWLLQMEIQGKIKAPPHIETPSTKQMERTIKEPL
jgi:hypothetical protein